MNPARERADRRRQQAAYAALGALLAQADRDDLPPIRWAVQDRAALVGEPIGGDPERTRAAYLAWRDALSAKQWLERVDELTGSTRYRADTTVQAGLDKVEVFLWAQVLAPDEDEVLALSDAVDQVAAVLADQADTTTTEKGQR